MGSDRTFSNSLSSLLNELPPFLFVGGIHGVGKSTLCDSTFAPAGYHCVTASSLIRLAKSYSDRGKLVDDISDNQAALLKQLEVEKKTRSHLMLDGHFCLLNGHGVVEPIEIDVFRAMAPSALLLVKCEPELIAARLNNRDGKNWSPEMLRDFQAAEEDHAMKISEALQIRLTTLSS